MGVSRVFKIGKRCVVKVRMDGRKAENIRLDVPPGTDKDSTAAQLARLKVMRAVESGTWTKPAPVMTLDQFLKDYERHYLTAAGPDRKESRIYAWRVEAGHLRSVVEFVQARGVTTLDGVTKRHVEQYRDWRMGHKVGKEPEAGKPDERRSISMETVKHAIRVAKAAWNWALAEGKPNPFTKIKFPKALKGRPRNLSEFEIRKAFAWAQDNVPALAYHAMCISLYSGARYGEVERLQRHELHWGEKGADGAYKPGRIYLGPGKDGEPRYTLFPGELQTILEPYRVGAGPVLPGLDYEACRRAVDRTAAATGVAFTFHDLRRSFAGWLVKKGVAPSAVKDMLGHADLGTTFSYYLEPNSDVDAIHGSHLFFGLGGSSSGSSARDTSAEKLA